MIRDLETVITAEKVLFSLYYDIQYMIILFILFITQLIVSYASMTVSDDQLKKIALKVIIILTHSYEQHFLIITISELS